MSQVLECSRDKEKEKWMEVMSSFSCRIHAHHAATLLGPDNEKRKKNILWSTLILQQFLLVHAISHSIAPMFAL